MTEKLSERVERLEGPDREIDFAIGEVVMCLRHVGAGLYDTDSPSGPYYSEDGGDYPAYPHYTASLDAAMSLVPEGWNCAVFRRQDWKQQNAQVWHSEQRGSTNHGDAATPAIALCAAALKARGL